jgi:hypothetical protein
MGVGIRRYIKLQLDRKDTLPGVSHSRATTVHNNVICISQKVEEQISVALSQKMMNIDRYANYSAWVILKKVKRQWPSQSHTA